MIKQATQYIVATATTAEHDIKKSRFIGVIVPCSTERAALQELRVFASRHPNANHLAFAWRIRQADGFIKERCNDGSEPSGTAGRPILAPLEGGGIIDAVVAVIRYFGGTKLGTGGLARAYGTAAKLAINNATLTPWIEMTTLKLTIEYAKLQLLEYQLDKCHGQIIDKQFTDQISLLITLPASKKSRIEKQFTAF